MIATHPGWMRVVGLAAVVAACAPAQALINLNYTVVDLVENSNVILTVALGKVDLGDGKTFPDRVISLPVTKLTALRGKENAPARIDLKLDGRIRETREELLAALTGPEADRAMIFFGDFSGAKEVEEADAPKPVAMLHVGGHWFALVRGEGSALVTEIDQLRLKEIWAGSDLTLEGAVRYALDDPRADFPVDAGAAWAGETVIPAAGKGIRGLQAVELSGMAAPGLLVMADGGDRFYVAGEGGKFEDRTGKMKLSTRSVCAAWGDFDGDGLLDLASWDGKLLTFCRMTASGEWVSEPTGLKLDGCASLSSVGPHKAARLVIAGSSGPLLAERSGDGKWTLVALAEAMNLGVAGPCVVGDFNGDGVADIAQLFSRNVLMVPGRRDGTFAKASSIWANPAGEGDRVLVSAPLALLAGDYDADGTLDLLAIGSGEGDVQLLRNAGGKLVSALGEAGEISYNVGGFRPNGAVAWDVNNDGREEFIVTGAEGQPLPFFNRGFRTFGYARMLELAGSDRPGAGALTEGQCGGVAADFDGDGVQEVALAAPDGRVVVLALTPRGGAKLALSVALAPGATREVCLTASDGNRRLGARMVAPGMPARFATRARGPLVLAWLDAAGKEQSQRAIVLKPSRVTLPEGG